MHDPLNVRFSAQTTLWAGRSRIRGSNVIVARNISLSTDFSLKPTNITLTGCLSLGIHRPEPDTKH